MPKIRYVAAGLSLHLYEVGLLGCVRLTTGHVICSPVTVCKNMKPRRGRNTIMEPDRTIPDRRRRRQRPDGVAAAAATSAILFCLSPRRPWRVARRFNQAKRTQSCRRPGRCPAPPYRVNCRRPPAASEAKIRAAAAAAAVAGHLPHPRN